MCDSMANATQGRRVSRRHGKGRTQNAKHEKDQSAMEYLLTYGWAILIVAAVLGVFFFLGIFNGNSLLPQACIAEPGFSCSNPILDPNGAVLVSLSYDGSQPITVTGLLCNVTSGGHGPSGETSSFTLSPGESTLVSFTCPIYPLLLGRSYAVDFWMYYNIGSVSGLESEVAHAIVKPFYVSQLWNITEWTPSSNHVDLLQYQEVDANPRKPQNISVLENGTWYSVLSGRSIGWSYATTYHNSDLYLGMESSGFPYPFNSLDADNAPCSPPYASHAYTATTTLNMSGTYAFKIVTDDATEIFYKKVSDNNWQSVFNAGAWRGQAPTKYTKTISLPQAEYQLAIDWMDICDPAGVSAVNITQIS